ncbi:MAG: sulfatase-like hydrolase/transferase [Xanthomonadales bacterium]|nr:sulfatase-like hydrolase/transferase [Xanthomonadales bacterium]
MPQFLPRRILRGGRVTRFQSVWQRYRPLAAFAVIFLSIAFLTRLALLFATGDEVAQAAMGWPRIFAVGFGYDLLALIYLSCPLVLWLWWMPKRWLASRPGRVLHLLIGWGMVALLLFVAVAEWVFWEEFQTRFNFIAVDYLVYTTEVLGNIRESYPVGWILTLLAAGSASIMLVARHYWRSDDQHTTFLSRTVVAACWFALTAVSAWLVSGDMKDLGRNQYADELSGNGIYQFFAAYRSSSLDYNRFYRTLSREAAYAELRRSLDTPDAHFINDDPYNITRDIVSAAPERRLNVVLISIESLSASYSGSYGRPDTLTPELDKLTDQSLVFSKLYASGTRTVRGLEALALSVPPTPGESIVKRPGNEGLFSLAEVFNAKGYVSEFLYGGYGAFDNMNYFFGQNGYRVADRSDIPVDGIHHANIWGVADEDLYSLALTEFDRLNGTNTPFFAHIMTTSNHRPYTFPEGRVDRPQGERNSAVAYTDWAIGDFLRRARAKPWFDDTLFVITADHCASSGGIAQLPVFRYHIPMWIFAPKHIQPARVDRMMAQIDIGPTVLGLLGFNYQSQFYGADLFQLPAGRERALIGNYQRLGYLRNDQLIELAPHRQVRSVRPDFEENRPQPDIALDPQLTIQAISYYQTASDRFRNGLMRVQSSLASHSAANADATDKP